MDKRLINLLATRGNEIRGGQMLDTYNQQIQHDVSCTIRTNINTANHHYVVMEEPMIGAMRGRHPDNPSERAKSNGNYKQRLEINEQGTSNTITSVAKDNYVIEPQVLTPKRTEYGKSVRKKYEAKELNMSRHEMTTMEPRTDGITNTLTSVQKDNLLAEPLRIPEATKQGYAEAYEGDSINLEHPNSTTRRGRVGKQMANTLDTACNQGVVTPRYRIRKLTPRECFRLQGVDDKDIDTLQNASISNSQLYKLAGNSITVDVLYHLFRKLFVDKGSEMQQQTLF